jgi:hypothetical protein
LKARPECSPARSFKASDQPPRTPAEGDQPRKASEFLGRPANQSLRDPVLRLIQRAGVAGSPSHRSKSRTHRDHRSFRIFGLAPSVTLQRLQLPQRPHDTARRF